MRHAKIFEPLETQRLILRPFLEEDAEAAFAGWFGDPQVMRFTPGGPDKTTAGTRKRLAMYRRHQESHGFSKWLVLDREGGEAIGDAGLLVLDSMGQVDFNLRLARSHWGRGLGTEIANTWARVAFEQLGLERLTAFAHPANEGLARVLEKSGFQAEGASTVMDMEAMVFVLEVNALRLEA